MSRDTPHTEMRMDEWMKRERNQGRNVKQDSSNLSITHIVSHCHLGMIILHLSKWVVHKYV